MHRVYYVYILASLSRRLYVGVTSDLHRRVWQHRNGAIPGFTTRYRIGRLVYYEAVDEPLSAIAREKQIKGWTREKRLRLVETSNAGWIDLAADWFR
jgi:putative endonuclease